MSRDFYFNKWRETLKQLKELVDFDVQYQVTKAHDPTLPEAVHRLSSILGRYMLLYNQAMECLQQNLQVQKTTYMENIAKGIVSRILELKSELEKLEDSRFQFVGNGLIEVHHTICDVEMSAIPMEPGRPEHIQAKLEEILARVRNQEETVVNTVNYIPVSEVINEEAEETNEEVTETLTVAEAVPSDVKDHVNDEPKTMVVIDKTPEVINKTKEYVTLIQAHERTRQLRTLIKRNKLRREMWEKQLTGTLQPVARYDIRQRSSELIQTVFRAYFELKRERIKNRKRDKLLGISICDTYKKTQQQEVDEMLENRCKLYHKYKSDCLEHCKHIKKVVLKNQKAQLCEEARDQIREWFTEWFESIQFFHDIPRDGSAAIFKGEVLSPLAWREENKAIAIQNEANKKKSPEDLKFQKKEAKRLEMAQKREEQNKLKAEALLLKKMMKNPTMHPGFNFPLSKRTAHLLEVIDTYHKSWDIYDAWETSDVKEKYVDKVDVENVIAKVKLEILPKVDLDMRQELQQLKRALKEDYTRNEEEMPVDVTKHPMGHKKKKKEGKTELSAKVVEMIVNLAQQGFIKEYPKTKIEHFTGDANFCGEDLRTQILPAFPLNFEIRTYWWERCREVSHGFHKILLVGPNTSGKTVLVHALASVNDAVLFELDLYKVQGESLTPSSLKRLMHMVTTCARALQPAVIHIKYVQKLFYTKTPPEEAQMNLALIKTFFIQKLIKKIQNTDKITIIGTCTDPWMAKSSEMLKQFPEVLLLPDNSYSVVVQMLNEWLVKNKIPADFNVSNLARMLLGYSYGYLKEALEKFMSADRIVKMASTGLSPMEVYNFILDNESESTVVEYDKYLKWYTEKTTVGMKEMQHLEDQRQFKAAVEKFEAKNKKKKRSAPASSTSSNTGI